jgi:small subunit ribosomal protein S17
MPKKRKSGIVVSTKMDKTIVVAVEERQPHKKYGKIQKKTIKFKAHDEFNQCVDGLLVTIEESSNYSKEKCWRLVSLDSEKVL